ncbi:restriction endonuclease subunit S [Periweissella ghanensis]|uniref:Type I restriction modification DNA specificity domain-containing protein n=1 Tax=Periweissella ghanensis TaxID=467997 RepID=A0ABN8BM97_9LACO|nr:restriction endonuclease subunit S [Periweissella ghanensis]MCM0601149.1 restriction endonuclease subunit S [Periweissella ghanensis]CAH0417946.1 hypothetical protein WGH24286_00362 [Periweissella ghanensis]
MKLNDLVKLRTGEIITRIGKRGKIGYQVQPDAKQLHLYEKATFTREAGFYVADEVPRYLVYEEAGKTLKPVEPGSLLISIMSTESAITTGYDNDDIPYLLTANYAEVTLQPNALLDLRYLNYWFNETDAARRQLELANEVKGATIKRLNVTKILDFDITLPVMDEQQRIGRIYQNTLMIRALEQEQTQLGYQLSIAKLAQGGQD